MNDRITERDKKEKMQSSIIKWWNVHYMTPQELEEAAATETPEQTKAVTQDEPQEELVHGGEGAQDASEELTAIPDLPQQQNTVDETIRAQAAEAEAAREILDRLQREAEADEAKLQQEIEEAKLGVERIQSVLSEKDTALRELIEQTEDHE